MHNCRIHKMEAVTEYMLKTEFKFVFTAPYSSRMNPIEEVFGTIKAKLRQNTTLQKDKVTQFTQDAIHQSITKERIQKYFNNSCYYCLQQITSYKQ